MKHRLVKSKRLFVLVGRIAIFRGAFYLTYSHLAGIGFVQIKWPVVGLQQYGSNLLFLEIFRLSAHFPFYSSCSLLDEIAVKCFIFLF